MYKPLFTQTTDKKTSGYQPLFADAKKLEQQGNETLNLNLPIAGNVANTTPAVVTPPKKPAKEMIFPTTSEKLAKSTEIATREQGMYPQATDNEKVALTLQLLDVQRKRKLTADEKKAVNEGIDALALAALQATGELGAEAKVAKEFSATSKFSETVGTKESRLPQSTPKATTAEVPPITPHIPPQTTSQMPGPSSYNESLRKVMDAIKQAEPIRAKQEAIYTAERGQKMAKALSVGKNVSGEAGFKAELSQLSGEMSKVEFDSIRQNVGQEDIDNLFNAIKDSGKIDDWEKITARKALGKIFGEFGGKVPTEGELKLLNKVFPEEFVTTILGKQPFFKKMFDLGLELANVPRSIMASLDVSAPFRQGLFLGVRHPVTFFKDFVPMFKALGSERAYQEILKEIGERKTYPLMKQANLAITDVSGFLSSREEKFMSSLAERIPGIGKVVRASGRAYTGFLSRLRADVFDDIVAGAIAGGRDVAQDPQLLKELGRFVNTFSGRGNIPAVERAAQLLNGIFFSPRLAMSRLTILNPIYYIKADPLIRKEALKSLFAVAGAGLTMITLAKLGGAETGGDPHSSDFGKIIIGNTRIDPWGGTQQYVRMAAQLLTGKYVSSVTGKEVTLGEGYKPLTRYDIFLRQIESKEAPIASFITDLLKQQDYRGQPINIPKEIGERFVPMVLGDMYDLAKTDPKLLPLSILGALGMGLQVYQQQSKFKFHKPTFTKPATFKFHKPGE